ncbi:MAG: tetratricopeptide repeat protein [Gammaproteobacteria bacterium]|nr:tetratricopeptide repeat protein [Gammaproteobacteria bacterium]
MRILINNSLPAWLFIFCVIVFASSLGGDFVMDDWPVIKENSKITDTKYIPDYFTRGVWANTDLAEEAGIGGHSLYRPVFLLTLNLSYQLWGDSALGYHALNLTLHSINTILVYFLILGFLSPSYRMVAGMSAAIFAVHPVHVESVAWIAGMTDPLVSLFLLSGFLLHRRWYQSTSRKKKWIYAISAPLCFALALLSKETAIFFPLILIIYDVLFQRDTLRLKSVIARYLTYAALLLIYFVLRSNALDEGDIQQSGAWARINFQNFPVLLAFFTHYIQLLVFPSPLEYYYSPPTPGVFVFITGGLFFIGALFYLPRALRQQQGLYVLAIAWVVITLLPALPIALFDEPVFAQRVLYLPSVGFAMLIAWAIRRAQQRSHTAGAVVKTTAIVFLISFSVASMTEIADWENDTVFYSQAMKTNPDSFQPLAGLAAAYARNTNQNTEAIIDLYLKAAELAPRETDKINFQENVARIYGQSGNISKSEQFYRNIVHRMPKRSSAWVGLGNNALARGEQQQALRFYQRAYEADPNNRIASHNLALVYRQLGRLERAAFFRRLAQTPPVTQ